jgi:hypothetical protein
MRAARERILFAEYTHKSTFDCISRSETSISSYDAGNRTAAVVVRHRIIQVDSALKTVRAVGDRRTARATERAPRSVLELSLLTTISYGECDRIIRINTVVYDPDVALTCPSNWKIGRARWAIKDDRTGGGRSNRFVRQSVGDVRGRGRFHPSISGHLLPFNSRPARPCATLRVRCFPARFALSLRQSCGDV